MGYILGLLVVILFFAAMHYFTELNTRQKAGATLFFVLIIGAALYYNHYQNMKREHITAIALKFEQNKKIVCETVDVNRTNFTESVGTYTFIGKEGSPHAGRMFSFEQCQ